MTEYGRGPGSEPWHPDDPLYGDQGWGGQQAATGQGQYDGQGQYQGQADQYDGHQQPYQPDPYAQQPQQGYPQAQQDPYAQQYDQYQQPQQPQYGSPQDPYAQQQPQQGYPQSQQPQQQYNGGWDTGQQAAMPYNPQAQSQPQPPYGNGQGGYGDTGDYYGTPQAYPPPQPPGHREPAPEPQQQATDWDPDVPQEETHPFFTGADDPADGDAREDDDGYDDDPQESRRGKGKGKGKKKKNRSGCACLVVSVVLVGGLGGMTYVGYSYYKSQFGPAPDFEGSGTGSVEVEIPTGALGNEIASLLKEKGVVKSVDAFVSAQNENPKGRSIQAGVYLLKEGMSADSAVKMMLDPKSQNLLVIPEGTRNSDVYAMIDKKLELKNGTTKAIAKTNAGSLGLPDWADDDPVIKDPLEGFLYPAAYPVTKASKPEAVLQKMVGRANTEYDKLDLEKAARSHDLDGPWQVLTVASLVQAEGKTHEDFRKMSEVVYNRLKPSNTETNQLLQFDSTFNYLKGQSEIKISESEVNGNKDPYNTYTQKGLTPGPISNPGNEALAAALTPTADGWLYFVATDGKHKTEFAKTYKEFLKLKDKFDALD